MLIALGIPDHARAADPLVQPLLLRFGRIGPEANALQ
ncbi:hypothetical protein FHT76_001000 [Rhizobium sp. BK176]|nr:hypothetical protein [Rhizobium sp. BK176]